MKMIRLFSGNDGQSHLEDVEIELKPIHVAYFSDAFATNNIKFGTISGVDEIPWHTQAEAAYIIILKGAMELEVGDGTKRIINTGDILLAEDTVGQGHITRSIHGEGWDFLIAPAKLK